MVKNGQLQLTVEADLVLLRRFKNYLLQPNNSWNWFPDVYLSNLAFLVLSIWLKMANCRQLPLQLQLLLDPT